MVAKENKWWNSLILQVICAAASRAWDLSCLLAWNPRQQLPLEVSEYLPPFYFPSFSPASHHFTLGHLPLPWCFASPADKIFSWSSNWLRQSTSATVGLSWQLPVCRPWKRSSSTYFMSYHCTQHILGLSVSSIYSNKSLCHVPRFSYNLGTKCILINIHPRTNQEA